MQEAGSGHSWGPCLGPVTGPGTLGGWRASPSGPLEGQAGTTGWARVSGAVQGPRAATLPLPSARFWSWVCPGNGPLCPLRFWGAGKASGTMNPVSTLRAAQLILGPAQKGSPHPDTSDSPSFRLRFLQVGAVLSGGFSPPL